MKQTFTQIITNELTLEPLKDSYRVHWKNECFYVSKKEWDATVLKKDPFQAIGSVIRYHLFDEEFFHQMNRVPFYLLLDKRIDTFKDTSSSSLNIDEVEARLLFIDFSNHLAYPLDSKVPYNIVYRKNYIGGLTNGKFDLKKIEAKLLSLQKKGLVKEFKTVTIDSYNQTGDENTAIEFSYQFTPEMVKARLEQFANEDYPLGELKRVVPYSTTDKNDPFSFKDEMLSKAEQWRILNPRDEYEENDDN